MSGRKLPPTPTASRVPSTSPTATSAPLAANIFLKGHGVALPKVDDIAAEAFINAVALDAWKADGDDATVLKAAEWFRTTYEHHRRGVVSDHRVEYAYVAEEAMVGGGVVQYLRGGGITSIGSPTFPIAFPVTLIARVHWGEEESASPPVVRATMSVTNGPLTGLILSQVEMVPEEFIRSGHEHHRTGWMPTLLQFILAPTFYESASAVISLTIGDDEVAVIPFAAHLTTEVPDHV